jgi:hypothetical protein
MRQDGISNLAKSWPECYEKVTFGKGVCASAKDEFDREFRVSGHEDCTVRDCRKEQQTDSPELISIEKW